MCFCVLLLIIMCNINQSFLNCNTAVHIIWCDTLYLYQHYKRCSQNKTYQKRIGNHPKMFFQNIVNFCPVSAVNLKGSGRRKDWVFQNYVKSCRFLATLIPSWKMEKCTLAWKISFKFYSTTRFPPLNSLKGWKKPNFSKILQIFLSLTPLLGVHFLSFTSKTLKK